MVGGANIALCTARAMISSCGYLKLDRSQLVQSFKLLTLMETSTLLDIIKGVASAPDLKQWPIQLFMLCIDHCEQVAADAFLSSKILTSYCYRVGIHEYLIICIAPTSSLDTSLWLRIERHPTMESSSLVMAASSSQELLAHDTITLSSSLSRLRELGPADKLVSVLTPDDANNDSSSSLPTSAPEVRHLIHLLRIIRRVSPTYGPLSSNCRWFARVIANTFVLCHGVTDMATAPMTSSESSRSNKIDMMMETIGKDTKKAASEVLIEYRELLRTLVPPSRSQRLRRLSEQSSFSTQSSAQSSTHSSTPSSATSVSIRSQEKELSSIPEVVDPVLDETSGTSSSRESRDTNGLSSTSTSTRLLSLLQDTFANGDFRDRTILVKICTAFVSDADVLAEIRIIFTQLDEVQITHPHAESQLIRNRALRFIEEWGVDYLLDPVVLSELVTFMTSRGLIVPYYVQERLKYSTLPNSRPHPYVDGEIPDARRMSTTPVSFAPPTQQRKFISEFNEQEMRLLCQQLREFERRIRGSIEQKHVINWLRGHKKGANPILSIRHDLLQICHWVVYSVLDARTLERRARVYKKFANLAQFCLDDMNYSTCRLILSALSHNSLRDLEHTIRLANSDKLIDELRERIPPGMFTGPSPATIPPSLSALLCCRPKPNCPLYPVDTLNIVIIQTFDYLSLKRPPPSTLSSPARSPLIDWTRCVHIQNALDHLLPTKSTSGGPISLRDAEFSAWLRQGLEEATGVVNADWNKFSKVGRTIRAGEGKEWNKWLAKNVGFNV